MFKIIELEIDEGILHFVINPEIDVDYFEVSFRLRDNERWVFIE